MTDAGTSVSPSWLHVGDLEELELDAFHSSYRRILLETPSGFALFDVHKVLFKAPEHMWSYFTDEESAREVAFAIGFVKVEDKSLALSCNSDLSKFIRKLCAHRTDLIVQDDKLKGFIEEKLNVTCSANLDNLSDLMWGLEFALHVFVPREDNLSNAPCSPLCKGIENALEQHKLNVGYQMDRDFIKMLGNIDQLCLNHKLVLNKFREFFDYLFHDIGEKYKDGDIYLAVLKHIFLGNVNLSDIQSNLDVSEESAQSLRNSVVGLPEHSWIVTVLEYLDTLDKHISCALQYVNVKYVNVKTGGSQKDTVQLVDEFERTKPQEGILNDWLVGMLKMDFERSDGIEKGGENDLNVAGKRAFHNCVDLLDTQGEEVRVEDGMSHVEKDTASEVEETAPQVEEITMKFEEETAMKFEEETAMKVEEGAAMKVEKVEEETDMKVEKVEEETAMKVEKRLRKGHP